MDTANYTILGSVASGNNYIKMSVSGTTLTATWIQDISSYTYNTIYGYLASGTDMILPYLVTYDGSSVYNKYRQDITQYVTDQNLRTTDSPHFANINPPVDNFDAIMPAIGIGGFTFGVNATGAVTLPPAPGVYMHLDFWDGGNSRGTSLGGVETGAGQTNVMVMAWRIS